MTTIAAFHAHPDAEALLTGGTLAGAAAMGHRVILITATDGEAGLSALPAHLLGDTRRTEVRESARILGCCEVVGLGYPDSGMVAENPAGFAHQPVAAVAERLTDILTRCQADVLLGYDRNGGYGHPDHLQVHRVARFAAEAMPGVRLLESTIDRAALQRAVRVARGLRMLPGTVRPGDFAHTFSDPKDVGYHVNVRGWLTAKRRAMRAHQSQAAGGADERTLSYLSRLPRPLFRMAFQTEWFTDPEHRADDVVPGLFVPRTLT
jgi:LmbE family N-acetylglucosaminyl deacetylase